MAQLRLVTKEGKLIKPMARAARYPMYLKISMGINIVQLLTIVAMRWL